MFGEMVKQLRLQANLGLREFCREIYEDPSNWSKVEREKIKPPQEEEKLRKIAKALKLSSNSEQFKNLIDVARIDAGRLPDYIAEDDKILSVLPAFLRTLKNKKPSEEEIRNIMEFLRKGV